LNLAKSVLKSCRNENSVYLPTVGLAFAGGYYGGYINVSGSLYAIVIAPKATGEAPAAMLYRSNVTAIATGNESTNDGILIRNNMIAAGISTFPAQEFCVNLSIGGYTDWYLPTTDELEIIYRNLKAATTSNAITSGANPSAVPPALNYSTSIPTQTTAALFKTGGAQAFIADYYSSASKSASTTTYYLRRMTTGATYSEGYQFTHFVRAVRRVLIS